ncbi:MAG TPA: hypothetical protein G4O14_14085 [Anaerolineae bacterium]|nr:hypothetical protein [Anaerolineae bacterium]
MSVRKGHLKGVPKNMLRVRLRIKGIKGASYAGRELSDKVRPVEPIDSMVQRLRLNYN